MRDMETARATAVTDRRVWRRWDETCFAATKRSNLEDMGDKAGYNSALKVYSRSLQSRVFLQTRGAGGPVEGDHADCLW